jgi:hypothetical protein
MHARCPSCLQGLSEWRFNLRLCAGVLTISLAALQQATRLAFAIIVRPRFSPRRSLFTQHWVRTAQVDQLFQVLMRIPNASACPRQRRKHTERYSHPHPSLHIENTVCAVYQVRRTGCLVAWVRLEQRRVEQLSYCLDANGAAKARKPGEHLLPMLALC